MTFEESFLNGLVDGMEKQAAKKEKMVYCPVRKKMVPESEMRSGGKGRGLGRGKGKGPIGIPAGEKRAGLEIIKEASSKIKAKIEAARKDPSTKANPKDTGPPGSGLQDPRVKYQQMLMRAKKK